MRQGGRSWQGGQGRVAYRGQAGRVDQGKTGRMAGHGREVTRVRQGVGSRVDKAGWTGQSRKPAGVAKSGEVRRGEHKAWWTGQGRKVARVAKRG